jgi:hypothetical protein
VAERVTSLTMDVCLVEIPFHAGDGRHPSSLGPQRLLEAGAVNVFAERGLLPGSTCEMKGAS